MIVAVDGPAGSGKSSVARRLAERKGFVYLDTGALYRALTYAAHTRGIALDDTAALISLATTINLGFITTPDGSHVTVDGVDCERNIRTDEVDADVSAIAAVGAIRAHMVELQRQLAQGSDVVAEGRDIGTVVFPQANIKIYLSADPAARAHRRAVQRAGGDTARGIERSTSVADEKTLEAQLIARDTADSERAVAPLCPADDAIKIDSTQLSLDEVCDRICTLIDEARS